MKYTVVFKLSGPLADAVAVEWTDRDEPVESGAGWEPCIRLRDGRWRFSGHDLSAAEQPHLRDPGLWQNIAIRYRLEAAGAWSPVSKSRKEITILEVTEDGDPPIVAPVLLAGPFLAGAGKIGQPVDVDPGLWSGDPTAFALQWCRDGAEIAGATDSRYTPGAEDDLADLTCRVVAMGAGGATEAVSAAMRITYVGPTAKGELFDEVFDEGTGPQTVEAAADFIGEALAFSVEGAQATIDAATGTLSIPTDRPLSGETVTVTAANSGGEADSSFMVTVEEAPIGEEPEDLPPLGPDDWEIVELVEDPHHSGMVTGVIRFSADGPAANAVRAYWSDWTGSVQGLAFPCVDLGLDEDGRRRFRMRSFSDHAQWHARSPGETMERIMIRYQLDEDPKDFSNYPDPAWRDIISANSEDQKAYTVPVDFFDDEGEDEPPSPPPPGQPIPTSARSSISMGDGIVFTFNKSMQCGQYWNGDWFVHNPSGSGGFAITSIAPNSDTRSNGTRRHGAMRDITHHRDTGLDGANHGGSDNRNLVYRHALNVNPNVAGNINFSANQEGSIVKAVSLNSATSLRSILKRYVILTVVRRIPNQGDFRPSPHGAVTSKATTHNMAQIDYNRIPTANISGLPSSGQFALSNVKRYWGGPFPSWCMGARTFTMYHAEGNTYHNEEQAFYGPMYSRWQLHTMCRIVHSGTPQADRRQLVNSIVQVGLDMAVARNAGAQTGDKFWPYAQVWPLAFAAAVLGDASVRAAQGNKSSDSNDFWQLWRRVGNQASKYPSAPGNHDARYISQTEVDWHPPHGTDSRTVHSGNNGSWARLIPWTPAHIGYPWKDFGGARSGCSAGVPKQYARLQDLFEFARSTLCYITGGDQVYDDKIALEAMDRQVRINRGHPDGKWDMSSNSPDFTGGWTVWHPSWVALYDACRSRSSVPIWRGRPEMPTAPRLNRVSSSSMRIRLTDFEVDNGHPITARQYRMRKISSASNSNIGSSSPSWGSPVNMSSRDVTVTGLSSGVWQVQVRFNNSQGNGPWSTNAPWRGDASSGPDWVPSGPQGVVTL